MDVNAHATQLAQSNARRNLISNAHFVTLDVTSSDFTHTVASTFALNNEAMAVPSTTCLVPPFDLIVSNPPYISEHQWSALQPEVRLWEDASALVCADRGLSILRSIAGTARHLLRPPLAAATGARDARTPQLVMEFGDDWQTLPLTSILEESGFGGVTTHHDSYGRARWISGYHLGQNRDVHFACSASGRVPRTEKDSWKLALAPL